VLQRDNYQVVKISTRMGILGDTPDIAALKLEMADFLWCYFNMPLSGLRFAELIDEVFHASLRQKVHFSQPYIARLIFQ